MQDRYRKPPGYKPPQSAEELLGRYAKGERYLREADLGGADLAGAELKGANLAGANLCEADLSEADLASIEFHNTDLTNANLSGANLIDASLSLASLMLANLSRANLEAADLLGADLAGASLLGASLAGAELTGTTLSDADLTNTHFARASVANGYLTNVDLGRLCEASPPVIHKGPSVIDHRAVARSIRSPRLKEFLVRTGMPDVLADYMIEFAKSVEGSIFTMMRSTFISYGGPDEAFAKKLYEALHRNSVPTFLFSEHAVPGEKLHRMMRRGVNEHDRVVLICSKGSLDRKGVLNEIEETLAREARDGGETYLIPIRIDKYVFTGWKPKREDIAQAIRDRVVADFEGADTDDAKFTRELGKLLKALRKPRPPGASGAG